MISTFVYFKGIWMTVSTLIASLGWAAGFVDGEGCIHLARVQRNCGNRINYRLRLTVTQNCRVTLEHLQGLLGATGYLTKLRRKVQHNKQIYNLIYDGRNAHHVIATLAPHLVRKRLEAQIALDFYAHGQPGLHPGPKGTPKELWDFRRRCYDKLRKLK
jgi:LAGLIDADG endonuclease